MSIYFVRHVKTQNNHADRISGQSDAEVLPHQSVQTEVLPQKVDRIFCSTATRCRKTLELMDVQCDSPVIYTDDLLERDVGILEGMKREDAIRDYPDLFCNGKIDVTADIPNGESIHALCNRLSALAAQLQATDGAILVCSHNQTLKALFAILKDIPITNDYWRMVNFPNNKVVRIDEPSEQE